MIRWTGTDQNLLRIILISAHHLQQGAVAIKQDTGKLRLRNLSSASENKRKKSHSAEKNSEKQDESVFSLVFHCRAPSNKSPGSGSRPSPGTVSNVHSLTDLSIGSSKKNKICSAPLFSPSLSGKIIRDLIFLTSASMLSTHRQSQSSRRKEPQNA